MQRAGLFVQVLRSVRFPVAFLWQLWLLSTRRPLWSIWSAVSFQRSGVVRHRLPRCIPWILSLLAGGLLLVAVDDIGRLLDAAHDPVASPPLLRPLLGALFLVAACRVGGLRRARRWCATFSSPLGWMFFRRNASSSRFRLVVSSWECGYVSRCTSVASSMVSIFSLPISHSMSSTSSGLPASIFMASRCLGDAPVTTRLGLLKTVAAWLSSLCGMNSVAFSFSQFAGRSCFSAIRCAASVMPRFSLTIFPSTSCVDRCRPYPAIIAAPPTM